MKNRPNAVLMAALLTMLTACGGDSSTSPDNPTALALSLALPPGSGGAAGAGAAASSAFDVTFTDGSNTLVITRAALVVREIELKRQFAPDCDDSGPGSDDSCEEFSTGPLLLELPLDGSVDQVVDIMVPADTYDELSFDIHKPSDDTPEDVAFIAANPTFADISILVEGTFNDDPFLFTTRLNEEQEVQLVPPLTVEAGGPPANLTLQLDLEGWFQSAGSLVDPDSANEGGENENVVRSNIRSSIDAFRDDDRNGER